jgi:hypothetical protein
MPNPQIASLKIKLIKLIPLQFFLVTILADPLVPLDINIKRWTTIAIVRD